MTILKRLIDAWSVLTGKNQTSYDDFRLRSNDDVLSELSRPSASSGYSQTSPWAFRPNRERAAANYASVNRWQRVQTVALGQAPLKIARPQAIPPAFQTIVPSHHTTQNNIRVSPFSI
jgi:hypothetical protein